MDSILLILLLLATLGILYLNLRSKPKDENKEAQEIANLKTKRRKDFELGPNIQI